MSLTSTLSVSERHYSILTLLVKRLRWEVHLIYDTIINIVSFLHESCMDIIRFPDKDIGCWFSQALGYINIFEHIPPSSCDLGLRHIDKHIECESIKSINLPIDFFRKLICNIVLNSSVLACRSSRWIQSVSIKLVTCRRDDLSVNNSVTHLVIDACVIVISSIWLKSDCEISNLILVIDLNWIRMRFSVHCFFLRLFKSEFNETVTVFKCSYIASNFSVGAYQVSETIWFEGFNGSQWWWRNKRRKSILWWSQALGSVDSKHGHGSNKKHSLGFEGKSIRNWRALLNSVKVIALLNGRMN